MEIAIPYPFVPENPHEFDLVLGRIIAAPATVLYRFYTKREPVCHCFCPKPWKVTEARLDLRPGGASYVALLPDSRIIDMQRQRAAAFVGFFELAGANFTAINGGSGLGPTVAFSIAATCADQAGVDRLWAALTDDGKEIQCGWRLDRFGLSAKVVPK